MIEKYYPAFGHLSAAGHAEPITDALATARLGGYTGEFLVEYTERSNGLIDFLLSDGPEQLWSSQVTSRLASLHEAVVVGPPGCGKSMLACRTATEWTSRAGIAIFLEAKHFGGDFPAKPRSPTCQDERMGLNGNRFKLSRYSQP